MIRIFMTLDLPPQGVQRHSFPYAYSIIMALCEAPTDQSATSGRGGSPRWRHDSRIAVAALRDRRRGAHEMRNPGRRSGHSPERRDVAHSEAYGRDRRSADSLAHFEDLFALWRQRLHHLSRLPGVPDQGVLRELLSAQFRR